MNHSVQAYWERIPIDQLILFLENDLFTGAYAINDAILQDILYKFSIKWFKNHFMHRRCVENSMRQDFVIFHFENNKIDNAARRCLRNKTKPFYCETVLEALISRNTAEGGCLFPHIHKGQEIQVKQKQSAR